jgi:hypothetical protein
MRNQFKADTLPCGTPLTDGSVYVATLTDGRKLCTTRADADLTMVFNISTAYAAKLDAHGHKDWALPDTDKLQYMRAHAKEIGGFTGIGNYRGSGWYATSTPGQKSTTVESVNFASGHAYDISRDWPSNVRPVRYAAPDEVLKPAPRR